MIIKNENNDFLNSKQSYYMKNGYFLFFCCDYQLLIANFTHIIIIQVSFKDIDLRLNQVDY